MATLDLLLGCNYVTCIWLLRVTMFKYSTTTRDVAMAGSLIQQYGKLKEFTGKWKLLWRRVVKAIRIYSQGSFITADLNLD